MNHEKSIPSNIHVKVCCISSIEEAEMAIRYGATAIGLVGPMPSGPGILDNDLIAEITKSAPPDIETFLLSSETSAKKILEHYNKVNTTTIQLVDSVEPGTFSYLKSNLPQVNLVQVIHVIDHNSILEAKEIAPYVDYILLDSGNPNLKVKELGGTGRTHNWDVSQSVVEAVEVPVYLAGGLHAGNVGKAISHVRPFGVDLCSGVRTDKKLDEIKLKEFFEAVENVLK